MTTVERPVWSFTAADLMSREIPTVAAGLSLPDAARELARHGGRGAPVVDEHGRWVGILSSRDLVRGISRAPSPPAPVPACAFQATDREPGGRESIRCLLADGVCPNQQARALAGGARVVTCTEPYGMPTDWQLVAAQSEPVMTVRDVMTTRLVGVDPGTKVTELARMMLDHGVHHLVVFDPPGRPAGVVAVNDLLHVLAHSSPGLKPNRD